jgi:hypothetical protein
MSGFARQAVDLPVPASSDDSLGDPRFRALLARDEWAALPPSIRRRFSKRLAAGRTAVYAGEVLDCRMSRLGLWLAHAARLIGSPLPLWRDAPMASVVTVTEDHVGGGQIWTRLYTRRGGFPQIVHSAKRFAGPTGLEEHVGRGVGMTLTVHVENGALVFRSGRYFVDALGIRLTLPRWLAPGRLTVTHAERGDGRFSFTLELVHPRFGALIRQSAAFWEADT